MKGVLWLIGGLGIIASALAFMVGKSAMHETYAATLAAVGVLGLGLGSILDAIEMQSKATTKRHTEMLDKCKELEAFLTKRLPLP
jgi:hypothetical protein